MTSALGLVALFAAAGLALIRFREPLSRFQTDLNESVLGFLPRIFTTVTPSGVVLIALVFFFLALLGVVATIIGAA